MYCVKCGKELIPGAAFCTGCGQKIEGASRTPIIKAEEVKEVVEEPVAVVEPVATEETVVEEPEAIAESNTVEEPKDVEVVIPVVDDGNTQSVYTQPVYAQPVRPAGPVSKKNGITGMVLGCVGTFFSMFIYLGLISLVCGIIGSVFSKKAYEEDGFNWGMAKAGKITSRVAIIIGAIEMGLGLIYGCVIGVSICVNGMEGVVDVMDDIISLSTLFMM